MPWTPGDAKTHTKKASTPTMKRQWSDVANNIYHRTGDEARAIRGANSVVGKHHAKRMRAKAAPASPSGDEGDDT